MTEIFRSIAWMADKVSAKTSALALESLKSFDKTHGQTLSTIVRDELSCALERLAESLRHKGTNCCEVTVWPIRELSLVHAKPWVRVSLKDLMIQDQDGINLRFGDFFGGFPAVVAFFYTRCGNPNKCSLTVTKLARLQKLFHERGLEGKVKLAAFSYEPAYDLPNRLKVYGENRGIVFGEYTRFFRTPTGFEELQRSFDLGVGFIGSIVNRHRIELYRLDESGKVTGAMTRMQWTENEVMAEVAAHLKNVYEKPKPPPS